MSMTLKRELPSFSGIVFDIPAILIVQKSASKNNVVTITAEEKVISAILTEVKHDCLYIQTNSKIKTNEPITITVQYSQIPPSLNLSGVVVEESLIDVGFAKNLDINVSGVTNCKLKGNVQSLNLKISGVGTIHAHQLIIQDQLNLKIPGVGNVFLNKPAPHMNVKVPGIGKVVFE